MSGFWSSETLQRRLPELVDPYNALTSSSLCIRTLHGKSSMGHK